MQKMRYLLIFIAVAITLTVTSTGKNVYERNRDYYKKLMCFSENCNTFYVILLCS